ncbi:MAG: hypothetical protein WDO73_16865 [Ignavibacteriota bacterium]
MAEADQRRTQLDVDRYTPLIQQNAITQQDFDNATQNNMAAKAQVQAAKAQVETARAQITAASAAVQSAKAAVETAQINLGFTHIQAPIDGIPGIAQLQVGRTGQPRQRRDYYRLDGGSDQGLLHGQRAGVPRFRTPLPRPPRSASRN